MSKEIKERPILFSSEMVRAILGGRKTQTRRIIKPQPFPEPARASKWDEVEWSWESNSGKQGIFHPNRFRCPQGKPGDKLWVREAWSTECYLDDTPPRSMGKNSPILYHADEDARGISQWGWGRGRPSIHMPRWASRITLEIDDVAVERLQDISEEDARAEGENPILINPAWNREDLDLLDLPLGELDSPHRNGFALLWQSINGEGSWEENPYVWKISFTRIEK